MNAASGKVALGSGLEAYAGERDPLARVIGLGDRAARTGTIIGLALALSTHGYASARAMMALFDMQHAVGEIRNGLHEYFWTEYDIDLTPKDQDKPKPEEKPPEPEPQAPPEPVAAPKEKAPAKEEDPYDPPPPPSQAAKVLTQEPDPDEPVDMTGQGFVTGDGSGPGFGMVSAAGTGKTPTFDRGASLSGKEGGTGKGSNTPPPQGPDLSKAVGLVGSSAWDCPFPPEADAEQIDQAVVSIIVTVRPDGTAQSVKVVSDPGTGFGRAARLCALARRYTPALDRTGTPIVSASPPLRVRFTR